MGRGSIDVEAILKVLARTTDQIFSLNELRERLAEGRPLRMKYGVDLTAPLLHIGHAVNLWMYRDLQELGHKVVFLLGDFTTQIGDPTGRTKTRPILSKDEIERNAEEFLKQVKMVVSDDPAVFEVRRNSEWFEKMSAAELLSLLSMVTHDRLIARDMFQRRIEAGAQIYMHEMLYPILQGYDSAMLEADLTIVGSDQLFNEMMGRFFQERMSQRPQVIITSTLTPGIDGKEKQSKSLGNYIGLSHSSRDKYGRVMSIPDSLIALYFRVYTKVPLDEIAQDERTLAGDPMSFKRKLAFEIVKQYHGIETAKAEEDWFRSTFSDRQTPTELASVSLGKSTGTLLEMLRVCLPEKSNSQLRTLVEQRAVRTSDDTVLENAAQAISIPENGLELRVGKRTWFRIIP